MTFYLINRPEDSVIVSIMQRADTGKYSFVNFTHPHICKCQFDTVEDAIEDIEKQITLGKVLDYIPLPNIQLKPNP